jgi:hypothetical protein
MAETPAAENRLAGHKVIAFAKNVDLIGQQRTARLIQGVMADMAFTEKGDRYTDDMMGLSEPEEVLNDYSDTPAGQVPKYRRMSFFKTFDDGKWVGTQEKAEQMVDPTNPTVMAMGGGRERRRDRTVINILTQPAWQYDKDGDPQKVNFPPNRVIAVNSWKYYRGKADGGAAPSGDSVLTPSKLREAKVLLDKSEIEGERWVAAEEEDLMNLLTSEELTDADITNVKRLVDGEIDKWMGFTFRRPGSGMLPYNSGTTTATIPVWIKQGILYKERPLTTTRIQERADKRYRWHAYYESQDSGLRREDNAVVHILCKR